MSGLDPLSWLLNPRWLPESFLSRFCQTASGAPVPSWPQHVTQEAELAETVAGQKLPCLLGLTTLALEQPGTGCPAPSEHLLKGVPALEPPSSGAARGQPVNLLGCSWAALPGYERWPGEFLGTFLP